MHETGVQPKSLETPAIYEKALLTPWRCEITISRNYSSYPEDSLADKGVPKGANYTSVGGEFIIYNRAQLFPFIFARLAYPLRKMYILHFYFLPCNVIVKKNERNENKKGGSPEKIPVIYNLRQGHTRLARADCYLQGNARILPPLIIIPSTMKYCNKFWLVCRKLYLRSIHSVIIYTVA